MRPTIRPGICRTCSIRVVMKPKYGPPEDSGTPSGWPSPQTMSTPFVPHCPGGFSTASEVGIDHRDHEHAGGVREIGQRIDVLERAEEVRLLDHQRRDVLVAVLLEDARREVPAARVVRQHLEHEVLVAGDRREHRAIGRVEARGHRIRADFERRFARTAIRQASATAEAPS